MKARVVSLAMVGLLVLSAGNAQSQIASRTPAEQANIQRFLDFWYKVVTPLKLDEYKNYIAVDVYEHDQRLEQGLEGLLKYFRGQKEKFPNGRPLVDPVLQMVDGDITFMLMPVQEVDGKLPVRIEVHRWKDGKNIEHWDTASIEAPPAVPMLHARSAAERRNLDRVVEFWRQVFEPSKTERFHDYVAENYLEHDASVPTGGLQAFVDATNRRKASGLVTPAAPFVFTLVDGDMVALLRATDPPPEMQDRAKDGKIIGVDIVRVKNDKIVEHWGNVLRTSTSRVRQP